MGQLLVAATCGLAAAVKASIGLGFALLLVPVLQVVDPHSVPAVVLLLTIPMTALMAVRERTHLDLNGAAWLLVGRTVGAVPGALLVVHLTDRLLGTVVGVCLVAAGAVTVILRTRRLGPLGKTAAGVTAGIAGTAAAIGGPFMALAYNGRPGAEVRATLSVVFLFGQATSLGALLVGGAVSADHLLTAAVLLPPTLGGLLLGQRLTTILDPGRMRVGVVALALTGGVLVVTQSWL